MNNQVFSVSDIASVIAGAGLPILTSNTTLALTLVGVGVVLKVLVAVLNKYNIPVSAPGRNEISNLSGGAGSFKSTN